MAECGGKKQPPLLNEPSCPLVHAQANFSQVKATDLLPGVTTQTVIYVTQCHFLLWVTLYMLDQGLVYSLALHIFILKLCVQLLRHSRWATLFPPLLVTLISTLNSPLPGA